MQILSKTALLDVDDNFCIEDESRSECAEEESAMKNFTKSFPAPLKLGNSIDSWKYDDLTQTIGRVYSAEIDLVEVLESPNADAMLLDLAITSEYRMSSSCRIIKE